MTIYRKTLIAPPDVDLSSPTEETTFTNGELTDIGLSGPGWSVHASRRTTGKWKVNGHLQGGPAGEDHIRYYEDRAPTQEELLAEVVYAAKKYGYVPL